MKRSRKLMIANLAFLAAVTLTCGALGIVKADAAAVATESFKIDGADVRLTDFEGVRFITEVAEGYDSDYTFGTLVVPQAVIDSKDVELTLENVQTLTATDIKAEKWITQSGSTHSYAAVIAGEKETEGNDLNGNGKVDYKGIEQAYWNTPLTAVSYAYKGTDTANAVYTAPVTRTLAQVSSYALADEYTYDMLYTICDTVLGDDGFALKNVTLDGTNSLAIEDLFDETNGNEGLTAKWELAGDAIVLNCDEDGFVTSITGKQAGTATLTATIGNKTAEATVTVSFDTVKAGGWSPSYSDCTVEEYTTEVDGHIPAYKYTNVAMSELRSSTTAMVNQRDKIAANNWKYVAFDVYLDQHACFGIHFNETASAAWETWMNQPTTNEKGIHFFNLDGSGLGTITHNKWMTVVIELKDGQNYEALGIGYRNGTTVAFSMYMSDATWYTENGFKNSEYASYPGFAQSYTSTWKPGSTYMEVVENTDDASTLPYKYTQFNQSNKAYAKAMINGADQIAANGWNYVVFDVTLIGKAAFAVHLTSDVETDDLWEGYDLTTKATAKGIYFFDSTGNLATSYQYSASYTIIIRFEEGKDYSNMGIRYMNYSASNPMNWSMYLSAPVFYTTEGLADSEYSEWVPET